MNNKDGDTNQAEQAAESVDEVKDDSLDMQTTESKKRSATKKITVVHAEEDEENSDSKSEVESEEGGETELETTDAEVSSEDGDEDAQGIEDDSFGVDEIATKESEEVPSGEELHEEELERTDSEEDIDLDKTLEELSKQAEQAAQTDIYPQDPEVDAAVDDIVRSESDEVIVQADQKIAALEESKNKRSILQKTGHFFRAWWGNRLARWLTIFVIFAVLVLSILIPPSRYALLNLFGVRVSSSLAVIDAETRLPLKNIQVQLQDQTIRTNEDGEVSFSGLKLGSSTLVISKIGYADNRQNIVLGWGSNPLGAKELLATGEQFIFFVKDWLSEVPVNTSEAESGENSARSDDEGKITLTVGEKGLADAEVRVRAEGYREEVLSLNELSKETTVLLVPDRRHTFVSNRNGQFDLFSIDPDGKNEKLLLEATKKEKEVPIVLAHPTRNVLAYVSSRGGEQNRDGFIVDELFMVDADSGQFNRIARSEQLQLVGWHEDTLVFWQVVEGTSRSNPERSKLISYNEKTKTRLELAAANYFNDVRLVNGLLYYAVSSFAVPQSQAKLFTIKLDGSNKIQLIDQLVFGIFRTSYNTLLFAADNQKWFQEINRGMVTEVGSQSQPQNRRFSDSPDGKRTVWVEIRDGRGVLLMSNTDDPDKEERLLTLAGLDSVVYWLNNDSLVFRVIKSGETADYVIHTDKKVELKIVDVTASSRLYY